MSEGFKSIETACLQPDHLGRERDRREAHRSDSFTGSPSERRASPQLNEYEPHRVLATPGRRYPFEPSKRAVLGVEPRAAY